MKRKDYNTIKWEDYFYLDETSPSGLRWKVDRLGGISYKTVAVPAKSPAGTLDIRKTDLYSCWRVMFKGSHYSIHRIIYVMLYGSINRDMVIDHLDGDASNNKHSNLSLKSQRANLQNCKMRENNTSGITGVSLLSTVRGSKIYKSWVAVWRDTNRRQRTKAFSVIKFGHDEAFALAVAYRHEQIKLLNESGASYTNRHLENNERKANESS